MASVLSALDNSVCVIFRQITWWVPEGPSTLGSELWKHTAADDSIEPNRDGRETFFRGLTGQLLLSNIHKQGTQQKRHTKPCKNFKYYPLVTYVQCEGGRKSFKKSLFDGFTSFIWFFSAAPKFQSDGSDSVPFFLFSLSQNNGYAFEATLRALCAVAWQPNIFNCNMSFFVLLRFRSKHRSICPCLAEKCYLLSVKKIHPR